MTDFGELVLTLTTVKVRAWELLNDPAYCGQLKMGDFYDLMLRAGYSDEVAQDSARQRGWERLSAGVEM